jgi:hypothetical protein
MDDGERAGGGWQIVCRCVVTCTVTATERLLRIPMIRLLRTKSWRLAVITQVHDEECVRSVVAADVGLWPPDQPKGISLSPANVTQPTNVSERRNS